MGAKQSKRSVDISGKEADGAGEVAAAGAGGEGRMEPLADADALKPQLNGDAHIHEEKTDKEKQLDIGTPENEKDATTEKENKEQDNEKEKEATPVTNGDPEPKENGETTPAPEDGKKPKNEKVKKKWSLRSISFSRKDKPKQDKKQKEEQPKTNGEPEKVPEEATDVTTPETVKEIQEEAKVETESKDAKTPETPVTEPLTNGTSTPETPKVESPAIEEPTPTPAKEEVKPEPKVEPEPEQLPVNGLSLDEPKIESPEISHIEESKPAEPIQSTETAPVPESPVKKEVCVIAQSVDTLPPPLPANPPPSAVVSFAVTTMALDVDASLFNTAEPPSTIAPATGEKIVEPQTLALCNNENTQPISPLKVLINEEEPKSIPQKDLSESALISSNQVDTQPVQLQDEDQIKEIEILPESESQTKVDSLETTAVEPIIETDEVVLQEELEAKSVSEETTAEKQEIETEDVLVQELDAKLVSEKSTSEKPHIETEVVLVKSEVKTLSEESTIEKPQIETEELLVESEAEVVEEESTPDIPHIETEVVLVEEPKAKVVSDDSPAEKPQIETEVVLVGEKDKKSELINQKEKFNNAEELRNVYQDTTVVNIVAENTDMTIIKNTFNSFENIIKEDETKDDILKQTGNSLSDDYLTEIIREEHVLNVDDSAHFVAVNKEIVEQSSSEKPDKSDVGNKNSCIKIIAESIIDRVEEAANASVDDLSGKSISLDNIPLPAHHAESNETNVSQVQSEVHAASEGFVQPLPEPCDIPLPEPILIESLEVTVEDLPLPPPPTEGDMLPEVVENEMKSSSFTSDIINDATDIVGGHTEIARINGGEESVINGTDSTAKEMIDESKDLLESAKCNGDGKLETSYASGQLLQEPLPVSDKIADLIPEVPVLPDLNTESETSTDVAVAN